MEFDTQGSRGGNPGLEVATASRYLIRASFSLSWRNDKLKLIGHPMAHYPANITMGATKWRARTIPDLIIEVWEALDCDSVGAREIKQIQQALHEKFGEGAFQSPAAIARTVADEGAVLRHPEVFECDLKWRKKKMEKRVLKEGLDFSDLSSAFESVVKIEEKRLQLQTDNEVKSLKELRDVVIAARGESLLRARSKILDEGQRRQAKEISEWLSVWLQAPELFSDWLDLRRRSPEFKQKFPRDSTEGREL